MFRGKMTIRSLDNQGEVLGAGERRDVFYHLGFRFIKCLSMESLLQMIFIFQSPPQNCIWLRL